MSRFRAFAIHFGISLLIFLALAWLVVAVWYPGFFFDTDGGWQGIRIIVLVDLVLGPLLTLIVFKAGKPGLKFDLSVIATLQLVCLTAGTYVVYTERPLALVYVDGSFYSMSRDDYVQAGVAAPERGILTPPAWYFVDVPSDPRQQARLRGEMLRAGRSMSTLTQRYRPFEGGVLVPNDAADPRDLRDLDRESNALSTWREAHPGDVEDYLFYLYGARYRYLYLGFDRASRRFVGVLSINAPV